MKTTLLLAALLMTSLPQWASANATGGSPNPPNPSQVVDPIAKGNQLYEKGDYAGAAEAYRSVALTGKYALQRAYAWFNLGNCHVQSGSLQKAIVAYHRSVETAPTFSRAWSVLGDVYFQLNAIGEATMCYKRVLENEQDDFHARQMLGECALKSGDLTEALRHFDAAVKIEPEVADLYLAQSEALAKLRDYEAAEKIMEQAILRLAKPPADVFFYLGQLYELDGKTRKAVRAYEEGLSYAPGRREYWYRIVNLHQRNQDDFLALLTLEQAIAAGNDIGEMHLRRALILFEQKRFEKALEEFKRAWDLGSVQGRRGIENVIAVYGNQGDKKKAEAARGYLR